MIEFMNIAQGTRKLPKPSSPARGQALSQVTGHLGALD